MSREVDERVVSMQFDNKNFERNVSTTMSTLEKLKQKLNLSGASKGLENVGAAAKKVDMSGLSSGVETVRSKFSALEVMGVTALANITNSAVNAGKRMISALTIDPVMAGFNEYETKINSIQTIMSNTKSKGTTMEDVTRVIGELNTYADKTIYNFAEMTRNIGTFTAAGVGLEESASAIQGIANLAASSGSTSQQASTAMYQLSQALAAGTVKLMDWNSVVNAGMGGEKFQEALKATARDHGVAVDEIIESNGSFRDSLQEGWITADILNETLNKFTVDGAKKYAKSMQESGKWTKAQADALVEEAQDMEDAATKVKTFTQLWDTLKESAQSGWAQTWELIVGDFDEARDLFTGISDVVGGFINKMSEWRNFLVEAALDLASPWKRITDKLEGSALGNIVKTAEKLGEVTDKVKYFQDIVTKVWRGDYGNGKPRIPGLEEAGYDYDVVQDLVNKGYGYKLTIEDIEASHKKFGVTMETTAESTKDAAISFENLTDEQLRNAGLTEDEINLYRALEKEARRSGMSISELAKKMSEEDGRSLLIDSFKNIAKGIGDVFSTIKDAWIEIFNPPGAGELAVKLYGIISALNEFTKKLTLTDSETGELTETGEKLQRTFKGIFAIVDILSTFIGGGLKFAFKVVSEILKYFNLDILDVTAYIGDALVKFRDWVDSTMDLSGVLNHVVPFIMNLGKCIGDIFNKIKESGAFTNFVNTLSKGGTAIREWLSSFKSSDNIPRDIILGLVNGIKDGVPAVVGALFDLAKSIISSICEVLGIQSPSTVFFAIGGFIISGLLAGLTAMVPEVKQFFVDLGAKISEVFTGVDLVGIIASIGAIGLTAGVYKIGSFFEAIASPLEGLGDIFSGVGKVLDKSAGGIRKILNSTSKVVKSFSGVLKAVSLNISAKALLSIAGAILMLVGAIAILTFLDPQRLVGATVALVALMTALGILMKTMTNMGDGAEVKIAKFAVMVISMAGALMMLVIAAKIIAGMSWDDLGRAGAGLAGLTAIIAALVWSSKLAGKDIEKIGPMLLMVSGAIFILALTAKILAGMSWDELGRAGAGIGGLTLVVAALIWMTKLAGANADKIGPTIGKIGFALLMLSLAAKVMGSMSWDALARAGAGIGGLTLVVAALIWVTKLAGPDADKIGGTIAAIGGSILILSLAAKVMASMSWDELARAGAGILGLGVIVAGLIWATKLAGGGDNLKRVGITLLLMSVSIGILAAVAALLGLLSVEHLAKGIVAVSILAAMMALMVHATKGAQDIKDNLIVMTVAIGVMAAAVAGLSFIDPARLAVATGSLAVLMGMFALIIKAGSNVNSSIGTLIVMTVAVGVLAGLIYLLSTIPVEASIGATAALSILLLAVSGCLVILSNVGKNGMNALIGVGLLLAMAIPLLAFVGVLALMQNVQNATTNAMVLVGLAAAMTLLMIPLSLIGAIWPAAAIGIAALTAMAIPLLAFVGVLAIMQNVTNATNNIDLLLGMMNSMTNMLVKLAIVGPLALIGVAAITALTGLMVAIGLLATGIGALVTEFPNLQTFLDTGIPIMEKLAYAIGAIVGNLIAGFTNTVAATLPFLAEQLSLFMLKLTPFIVGIKMVDTSVLEGAGILSGAILALMATDLIANLASFGTCGATLVGLGSHLSAFMEAANPFIQAASALDPTMLAGVKALAETILILTAADIMNGLTSWLTGGSSLEGFGSQLAGFGTSLNSFVTNVGVFSNDQLRTVKCASQAIKTLAQASSEIPNTGGLLGQLVGENDLGAFSNQFPTLGTGLRQFLDNVGTFTDEQVATVSCAANAIKTLAEASSTIPNAGGLLADLVGDNELGTFSNQFPTLGIGLRQFLDNVGTFTDDQVATVTNASEAIKILADAANGIPNEGGFWASLVGDNSLSKFGGDLPNLGANLSSFATNLGTFNEDTVTTVKCASDAIVAMATAASKIDGQAEWTKKLFGDNSLSAFGNQLGSLGTNLGSFAANLGTFDQDKLNAVRQGINAVEAFAALAGTDLKAAKNNLSGFSEKLPGFAENMATFCITIPSVESISGATAGVDKIVTIIDKLDNLESFGGGAQHFVDALNTLADSAVDEFVEEFTGEASKTATFDAGASLLKEAIKGMESTLSDIETAIEGIVASTISAIQKRLNYDKFWLAGNYLVEGFALGINENTFKAEGEARAMAEAAAQAAQDELDINSPSKVFKAIGGSIPEGFAMGIDNLSGLVKSSSVGMANTALDNVKNSISRIADAVSGDIDYQPTIRPVLDLSDVRSGVDTMGNMLNFGSSVGVMGNIGAINSMMKTRGQNGANADVVSAIGKLGKSLGNVGNTSYNINGVNYSADSEVAEAIKVIARAMKIEGRT